MTRELDGAPAPGLTSSRRTLGSQASRRGFVLHCALLIPTNANLKTGTALVATVQYATARVVLLLGEQKVFGVG